LVTVAEPIAKPVVKGPRPKDYGWTDLDAEDEGDPTMVSEYVVDAFKYMMELEKTTMPKPDYMDDQEELQWKMRQILNDWIVEVHSKFRLLPETLLIAINLIDRFLSKRTVSLEKFQLVGLTALFVAAKYEEVICPSVTHFLHMADGGYDVEEILRAERYLLQTLDFDLAYPNPLHFLRRVSKADGYDVHARTVAKFFIEISCVEKRLIPFPPSMLAAAAMWLARLCFDRGPWHANMVHYSTYAQHELLDCAQVMIDFVVDPKLDMTTAFFKKYASRKHLKASIFARDWALHRWPDSAKGRSRHQGRELEAEFGGEQQAPPPPSSPSPGH
jgi:G2/mitotic-specific cyclin 1/2